MKTGNILTGMLLFTSVVVAGPAALAKTQIPVCQTPSPIYGPVENVTSQFMGDVGNASSGRAWVEITVEGPQVSDNGGSSRGFIRQKIEGLSLDSQTRDILYKAAGSSAVVCAQFHKGGWFSADTFVATGRCQLTARAQPGIVDDGFHSKKGTVIVAEMEVAP